MLVLIILYLGPSVQHNKEFLWQQPKITKPADRQLCSADVLGKGTIRVLAKTARDLKLLRVEYFYKLYKT